LISTRSGYRHLDCDLHDGSRTFTRQLEVSPTSDPLVTYLNDHLGGAQTAVQVLKAMRDHHDDPRFREFAGLLLPEILADDGTLRSIAEKMAPVPARPNKSAGGFLKKPRA
jgi:hypothetical protein